MSDVNKEELRRLAECLFESENEDAFDAWEEATHPWKILPLLDGYDALLAERDELRAERDSHQRLCIAELEKNAQLRAELEAIRGRKPSLDKWAEYKAKFCGCKDASRHNSCRGLATCQLPIGHPERKGEALPPQQPEAVSVPRELLEKLLHAEAECLHGQFEEALESLRVLSTKNAEEV